MTTLSSLVRALSLSLSLPAPPLSLYRGTDSAAVSFISSPSLERKKAETMSRERMRATVRVCRES